MEGRLTNFKRIFMGSLLLTMLLLSACGLKPSPQNIETSPVETRQIIFREGQNSEGPYWTTFLTDKHFGYVLYDKIGEEFIRDSEPGGMFDIQMLDENLLEVNISGGNGGNSTRYYDIERHLYSATYNNVLAIGYGKVAYRSFKPSELSGSEGFIIDALVVHDIFNPTINHDYFQRNYMEDMDPMNFHAVFPFSLVEFIDETHLHVEYLNSRGELVKETLELKG